MHTRDRFGKSARIQVAWKRAGRALLAVPALLSALVLGCASTPDTPEFRDASRQCRREMQRCPMSGTSLGDQCARSAEHACMASLGYRWVRGEGWSRVDRTDRDVAEELNRSLPEERRKTGARTETSH